MSRRWGARVTRNERSRAAARRRDAAPGRYGVPGARRQAHDQDMARKVALFLGVPSRTGQAVPVAAVEGDGTGEPNPDLIGQVST